MLRSAGVKQLLIVLMGWVIVGSLGAAFAESGMKNMEKGETTIEKATFAGGCFWCMQPPYDRIKGVLSTTVGYTGGEKPNPTYEEVSMGNTGHAEAVEIMYDPSQVSYEQLLDLFWKNIDPTTLNQQFSDRGTQYRTAIFYYSEEQKKLAIASKEKLEKSGKFRGSIVTEIIPASPFYPAEDYHQKYYKKCPVPYQLYKTGSGRKGFIQKTWGGEDH